MLDDSQLLQQWNSLEDSSRKKYSRKTSPCPEPTLSLFRPDVCFGSVSETFHCITDKYLQRRGQQREDRLDAHRSSLILNFMAHGSALSIVLIICLSKVLIFVLAVQDHGDFCTIHLLLSNGAYLLVTKDSNDRAIVDSLC